MKRRIVLAILVFVFVGMVSAQTANLFTDRPGAFVIYEDSRFEPLSYVGVCYLGANQVALRAFTPETGAEVTIRAEVLLEDGDTVGPGNMWLISGDLRADDATFRLFPMFLNWANAWLHARERFQDERVFTYEEDDFFTFDTNIPVLSIASIDANRAASAVAITAGIATSFDDPRFFQFAGLPEVKPGPDVTLVEGDPVEHIVQGLMFPLSEAWERANDTMFIVAQDTPQDAAIVVETIPYQQLFAPTVEEVARLMLIADSGVTLLLEGTYIGDFKGTPYLFKRMFDPRTNQVSVSYSLFIDRGGEALTIVSLSAFESVYEQNREHFDSILF